ncbi:MAG TPA: gamma-glutamylcyclotransferase [Casimicrobiaceae bacterium]|jgi:cation transport protein ChaC|nr:gamma-glutamylcyclotransferase [Casimicrobiaceae bacterium]
MTLSRRDLEEGRMRAVYVAAIDPSHALTDEELAASLNATLKCKPPGSGWWVFAYGSLLWNPLFPFDEARPATLSGRHRRFCLWSLASRGTSNQPGLVLGLDRGGSCHGVVYKLPARLAKEELMLLWRREMVLGAYRPLWVTVRCGHAPLIALAFVVDRGHRQYTGKLTLGEQAEVLSSAAGAFGSSADYLERARVALITHGIVDPYLERLALLVARRRRCIAPSPSTGETK